MHFLLKWCNVTQATCGDIRDDKRKCAGLLLIQWKYSGLLLNRWRGKDCWGNRQQGKIAICQTVMAFFINSNLCGVIVRFRLYNVLYYFSAATVFHSWGRIYLGIAEFCKRGFFYKWGGEGVISLMPLCYIFKVDTVICLKKKLFFIGAGVFEVWIVLLQKYFPFHRSFPYSPGNTCDVSENIKQL